MWLKSVPIKKTATFSQILKNLLNIFAYNSKTVIAIIDLMNGCFGLC